MFYSKFGFLLIASKDVGLVISDDRFVVHWIGSVFLTPIFSALEMCLVAFTNAFAFVLSFSVNFLADFEIFVRVIGLTDFLRFCA